ncbi:DUF480 domain-containing protein [Rubinisphaera margarita]|uniref:DUF480 domain-containing protein n=1 Tax=Rubinisphaera margarita TaxID=2909586 RepID=UPI001EE862A3|nr:DUF480 domain-containing protein [Rubinisphaera margarita]MCG6156292.1 YceH family protein [Rubinisphaera margarita]
MQIQDDEREIEFLGSLNKKERRVLGVLIEKSLTTPEYYPLTLKALASGCNQKSNREPVTNYDEFELEEVLDGLRQRGLIAAVQTAGGRTERFRHLLREATTWNAGQLAIMAELLLRGRQQLGELRSRASRMTAIESLDELREELGLLMQDGYVASSGDLGRRGVEVNHALYTDGEKQRGEMQFSDLPEESASASSKPARPQSSPAQPQTSGGQELREELAELKEIISRLEDRITAIETQLGI